MEFRVYEDIEVILTLLDMTIQEFANELGVSYSTVSRWKERGETVSPANLEKIYEYAFKKRIRLNKIKEQLFREEWMLMIAFFRGKLMAYENHPIIQRILNRLNGIDYVVAPIADNRMFQIIDSFIEGEITDVQCRHCLSATNLGNQYVFLTQRAADRIQILRKCYLASVEKEAYISIRSEDAEVSNDKVKIARKQYRGQGKYIEDILV